jgi:hypothetical protein
MMPSCEAPGIKKESLIHQLPRETVWKIAEECLDRRLWVLETSWRGNFIPFWLLIDP